jgi:hypothetical protein
MLMSLCLDDLVVAAFVVPAFVLAGFVVVAISPVYALISEQGQRADNKRLSDIRAYSTYIGATDTISQEDS